MKCYIIIIWGSQSFSYYLERHLIQSFGNAFLLIWFYSFFQNVNMKSLDQIKWHSCLHILCWFQTSLFPLGDISLVWNTTQSSLWFLPVVFSEQLGLTCLLLITWLCSCLSFWGCIWKRYCPHIGEPSQIQFQGFGIRVWLLFKALVAWLTIEVYGAIQVLPGFSCSTELQNFGQTFFLQYCCIVYPLPLAHVIIPVSLKPYILPLSFSRLSFPLRSRQDASASVRFIKACQPNDRGCDLDPVQLITHTVLSLPTFRDFSKHEGTAKWN